MNDINECCALCGKEFRDIKQIYVDVDTDQYICKKCATQYGRHIVDCFGKEDFDGLSN